MSDANTGNTLREKVDILIVNGLVVTMDLDQRIIRDGAVAISGTQIKAIGSTKELETRFIAQEVINAAGHAVMPGLINAHSHIPSVLFRGLVEDLPLYDWLDEMWKAEKKCISSSSIKAASQLGFLEMIQCGITTSLDMYWFPEISAEVAKEVGFRFMGGPVYLETDAPPDNIPMEERSARGRAFLQEYQDDSLIIPCVLPHSTYTVSPKYLCEARALADEFGVVYHTHASESAGEVADILQRYGKTPINHLEELGLLDNKTVLAHTVHLTDQEIELLAERGVISVHNPISNLKLGSGIARVPEMQQAGIPILLGTDGPQSSNDFNLWLTMRLTAILHKGAHEDPSLIPTTSVVRMVTSGAAEALGLNNLIGSLEIGKRADLILIDLKKPHLVPLHDIYAQLIYSVGREDVSSVVINGRLIMNDRQMLTMDVEETMGNVINIASAISKTQE
ncbi:MAG: amidohydrolase [Anaerolineaceae bacterium]|nr:amidohydrolase [Anaerolineaceae bacterium]